MQSNFFFFKLSLVKSIREQNRERSLLSLTLHVVKLSF